MGEMILENANVITMDPALPRAGAVRVSRGRIVSLPMSHTFPEWKASKAVIIDCRGKTVVPGFIDSHCHPVSYGNSFLVLDVGPGNVSSISDIRNMVAQAVRRVPPGTWIKGRGYNEFYLAEKRHPTRWDLDGVSPVNPVRLTHRSGHAHLLNSAALEIVGISTESEDPPGGMIERDVGTGEPTGLLYGMGELVGRFLPPGEREEVDRGMGLASEALSAVGIASVHDVSSRNDGARLAQFRDWRRQGLFRQRVTMALGWEAFRRLKEEERSGFANDDHVNVEGVKIIVDEVTGRLAPAQPELDAMVLEIHRAGFRAIIHAVEGPAIESACTAIERALKAVPRRDHGHRIEHCSVCTAGLARRLASAGIMVVTQPAFIYYNGERYLKTVAKEGLRHLYPVATLMREGVFVGGSADFPVVPPDPLMGIYGAVARISKNGEAILLEERISALDGLRLFTCNAARAIGREDERGSITPGKVADLVVLSDDPTAVPEEKIRDIRVDMTIINGEVAWERK